MIDELPACAIGVMAKTPKAGVSKTRLCPPLLPAQAAELSAAFLRDTTQNLADAARSAPIAPYVAFAPAESEEALRPHLAPGTGCFLADGAGVMPPGVEGFGRCLLHAIEDMFASGHRAACVLSSDTPTLPTRCLIEAAELLVGARAPGRGRVVLGGCSDGGYYLLGMTEVHAALFTDIAWSTETVAETTRLRARQAGLELVELDDWYDVDEVAALRHLLNERDGFPAPHTRAVIDRLSIAMAAS